jgi:hypothetical protein
MSGFQKIVNYQQAPAVEGDFASANPRRSLIAGEGTLIAGAVAVIVGRFAYALNSNGTVTNAKPGGASRLAFVHRNQPALNIIWLSESTMAVQPGLEMTLFAGGDFWCRFAAGAAVGQKVFVVDADGTAVAGTAGATIAGATESTWHIEQACAAGELAKINTGV